MSETLMKSAPALPETKQGREKTEMNDRFSGDSGASSHRNKLQQKLLEFYTTLDSTHREARQLEPVKAREDAEAVLRIIDLNFNEFVAQYRIKNKVIPPFDAREHEAFNVTLDVFLAGLSETSDKVIKKKSPESTMDVFLNALAADTKEVIESKVRAARAQQLQARRNLAQSDLGKRLNTAFTIDGLVETSVRETEQSSLENAEKVLKTLGKYSKKFDEANRQPAPDRRKQELCALRLGLGLPEVPQNLGTRYLGMSYDDFQKSVTEGLMQKDESLEYGIREINEALAATETVFDCWEAAFEVGAAVGITVVTGGAGPVAAMGAQLALTVSTEASHVYRGEKSVEQATQDALLGTLTNVMGAKVAKLFGKMLAAGSKSPKLVSILGKAKDLMTKMVKDPKKLEAVRKTASSISRNGTKGAVTGGLDGGSRTILEDVKKDGVAALGTGKTLRRAASAAGAGASSGSVKGAVVGSVKEGVLKAANKIRTR